MVFYGVLTEDEADKRFDHMLEMVRDVPFGKQPIIERSSATIVGYTGVDWYDFDNGRGLEYGYRLMPPYRGRGYATEASKALLDKAAEFFEGEIFAIIDPENKPSQNVCEKLGFAFIKRAVLEGDLCNLYRLEVTARCDSKAARP
jgi:RimJ/RimL family protein N-acetyltransferase